MNTIGRFSRSTLPALLFLLLPLSGVAQKILPASHKTDLRASDGKARIAIEFPGASIVEQIQAAIHDCGSAPCAVFVPAGIYDASPISSWTNVGVSGSRAGVLLPSNVEISGAGKDITTLRVVRSAGDPPATLFANARPIVAHPRNDKTTENAATHNIRIREMSIEWSDAAATYDWVSIFICHACDQVELDHLDLEGNPNKLVNLLDSTHMDVHDCTFRLHSTGYGHGDNALGVSHFDSGVFVGNEAGVVRDNEFIETGDHRTFSLMVVTQSGLYVHGNTFEAHLPPPGNATGIETGQDNTLRLAEYVKISGNVFHDASIAHGGLNNSEISGNFFDHGDIYIAMQSGATASVGGLTIANNELHFGSISIGGLEHTFTGRILVTGNHVFDGSIGTGNSQIVHDIEVSNNTVRYSHHYSGIDCNACSRIRDNVVIDSGQDGPGDRSSGFLIGATVDDLSDNLYLDDQQEYDAGTICSVANPASPLCMPSGKSRWVLLRGGEWGFGWTNRTLFTEHGELLIHAFVNSSLLELEEEAPALAASTHYHLYRTTYNAFELNSAKIERFANNSAVSNTGPFRHAAVQENGNVIIHSVYGNVFRPYSCDGKCAADYRSGGPK